MDAEALSTRCSARTSSTRVPARWWPRPRPPFPPSSRPGRRPRQEGAAHRVPELDLVGEVLAKTIDKDPTGRSRTRS